MPNRKGEGQPDLPEAGVDVLDPIFEAIGIESSHVPDQDGVDEISNSLTLLLRPGMHQDHPAWLSRMSTGLVRREAGGVYQRLAAGKGEPACLLLIETIMLSLSRQFTPDRCLPRPAQGRSGFTLIEIVIALAVLGTMAAGVYLGFNSINTYAVTSRLYSEAQTAAQNQIDLVLSREPFDLSAAYLSGTFNPLLKRVPIEVMTTAELDALATTGSGLGPVVFPTAAPSATPSISSPYYPYYPYYRTGSGQPISREAFIYQDPVSGAVVVKGTLVTNVVDTGMTMTFAGATNNLNVRRVSATVSYSFRNKNYNVSMDTLRTADQ